MRLKVPYDVMEVEGQCFAVPMDGPGKMIRLSKTARVIFELLQEETDEASIVDQLTRRYDADRETLEKDLRYIITKFREKDLLL